MFTQPLAPIFGSIGWSALFAALPLIVMFVLLGVFRVKAAYAALAGLALSIVLAVVGWQMPIGQALSGTAEGILYGMFPILWILINALWIYRLTLETGWFEALGTTIRSISNDLRVLSIIIAFSFGALLESLAGFGAPVAISAAMLIAAGMKPLKAALVSLLANTAPVAFGAMGAPIIALAGVTGLPVQSLAAMAGHQTPFIAFLVPLILVFVVDGRRGLRQTWPIALVAGVVFGASQFVTANYFAVELTDVVAAIATVIAVLVMLRFWQPSEIVSFNESDTSEEGAALAHDTTASALAGAAGTKTATRALPTSAVARTWGAIAPYLAIITIFAIAQIPAIKTWLGEVGTVSFQWPGLDITNADGEPIPAQLFKLDHLKATGTLLLFAGIVTMVLHKINIKTALRVYGETLRELRWTILTVAAVLGLAFVMNLSGQTASLGYALAATGGFFVLLSPVIGWVGVAITGSDTSSNSLFGLLQVTAANQVGLNPILMAAANSSAGVLGKMLSLQNLAVAAAAVNLHGSESTLFRKLLGWSLALLAFITLLIFLQSTPVLGWMVPQP
ncbi:L-lactate permease [Leucobacter insecticola]|uniref:L-lactate permease n=1 Tax=Leucobacter insecticola TaxID=2714934 RepID=A0A6G8FJ37_9MICO|nr:L-lactate permease [Leucobacter insecticola]QIM16299.1 L-lactate permease [Leucobacter insecticola]